MLNEAQISCERKYVIAGKKGLRQCAPPPRQANFQPWLDGQLKKRVFKAGEISYCTSCYNNASLIPKNIYVNANDSGMPTRESLLQDGLPCVALGALGKYSSAFRDLTGQLFFCSSVCPTHDGFL